MAGLPLPVALQGAVACKHAERREAFVDRRAPGVLKAGHQRLLRAEAPGQAASEEVRLLGVVLSRGDARLGSTRSSRPAAAGRPSRPCRM